LCYVSSGSPKGSSGVAKTVPLKGKLRTEAITPSKVIEQGSPCNTHKYTIGYFFLPSFIKNPKVVKTTYRLKKKLNRGALPPSELTEQGFPYNMHIYTM
jgi:hypothetical protein